MSEHKSRHSQQAPDGNDNIPVADDGQLVWGVSFAAACDDTDAVPEMAAACGCKMLMIWQTQLLQLHHHYHSQLMLQRAD